MDHGLQVRWQVPVLLALVLSGLSRQAPPRFLAQRPAGTTGGGNDGSRRGSAGTGHPRSQSFAVRSRDGGAREQRETGPG